MDLKKEYCQLNGYSKFNKYNENNYTKFLEKKITELNQALQLQKTGVMRSSSLVQCGFCGSVNCSNNKKCIKCGVRFL